MTYAVASRNWVKLRFAYSFVSQKSITIETLVSHIQPKSYNWQSWSNCLVYRIVYIRKKLYLLFETSCSRFRVHSFGFFNFFFAQFSFWGNTKSWYIALLVGKPYYLKVDFSKWEKLLNSFILLCTEWQTQFERVRWWCRYLATLKLFTVVCLENYFLFLLYWKYHYIEVVYTGIDHSKMIKRKKKVKNWKVYAKFKGSSFQKNHHFLL